MLRRRKTEMIFLLLSLQFLILVLLASQWLRPRGFSQDTRIDSLMVQLTRLENSVREGSGELRRQQAEDAVRARAESAEAAAGLRAEVVSCITTLGSTLRGGLEGLRSDNLAAGEKLRGGMERQMDAVVHRLSASAIETRDQQIALGDSIHAKLTELMNNNGTQQERLRSTLEERLNSLNT